MPTYTVHDPTSGKSVTLTGDSPPTEAELNEVFAHVNNGASAQAPVKPQSAPGSTFSEKIGNAYAALKTPIANALPTVGGIVGGAVGGVPGAAMGGAAGEGYRGLLEHASEIPGAIADVAHNLIAQPAATVKGFAQGAAGGTVDAAKEAAGQAAGQVIGNGMVAGASKLSGWLMNRATTRVTEKLMRDFPELSDTLIENALSVSKGGYAKAQSLLMAAKGKANAALKIADKSGQSIPVQMTDDLAQSFKTALLEDAVKGKRIVAQPGQPLSVASQRLDPATQKVFTKIDSALGSNGTVDITASEADLLKRQLQKESRALYSNYSAPNGPKAMGMDATERGEFASRLNDAIDGIAKGYREANAEAKPLIGAVRGIKQAIRPNGNLYQAMIRPAVGAATGGALGSREGGTPGSVLGAIAGAAATSPAGMSREAIILAHPAMQAILRQIPKPAAQALTEFLTTHLPGLQPERPEP